MELTQQKNAVSNIQELLISCFKGGNQNIFMEGHSNVQEINYGIWEKPPFLIDNLKEVFHFTKP